jgi:hypothetical protein
MSASFRDALTRQIAALFPDRGFDHALDPNGRGYVDHVAVSSVEIPEDGISVVGIGHTSFDVQFTAIVAFEADVEYDDRTRGSREIPATTFFISIGARAGSMMWPKLMGWFESPRVTIGRPQRL